MSAAFNCPSWCEVSSADHGEMMEKEGVLVHQRELATSTGLSGVILDLESGQDAPTVFVAVPNDDISLREARELLALLQRVVDLPDAEPGAA